LQEMTLDLPGEAKPEPAPKGAARDPKAPAPVPPVTHVALRDAAVSFGPLRDGVPTAGRFSLSGLVLPAASVAEAPVLGALPGYGY
ncbi:hypothetical protein OQJ42_13480, partial [Enterococcus faecium]|uniref:hypothetical protein n=1 Tax=Enterococcus faecium TaxID=1352 RepID=UPI0022444072